MSDTPIRPQTRTLIIPFAASDEAGCRERWPQLQLPHLGRWLARAQVVATDRGDAYRLNPPHERALAQALGWPADPDTALPWAAWQASRPGVPCAWFTPCHWQTGMEEVRLQGLDERDWSAAESQALMAALAPLCAEDGIQLVYETPTRWRAEGECFRDLPSASLDRVLGRRIDPWLPAASGPPAQRQLLRLMNEAQMLFYTHPVNDARGARGLPLANGLWISGSGAWEGPEEMVEPVAARVEVLDGLRATALAGDWAAWAQAWAALDVGPLAAAVQSPGLTLVLCGEQNAVHWTEAPAPRGWRALWPRWTPRPRPLATVLEAL